MARQKVKYLSNKELMLEIHRSKKNFSSFISEDYSDYDIIVSSTNDITDPDIIEEAKIAKAKRLKEMKSRELLLENKNPKDHPDLINFDPNSFSKEDIVFRVMTYEHIPYDPTRKKNPKTEAEKRAKVPFAPFKHYIIENNNPKEVGKSHWVGRTTKWLF